ALGGAPGRRRGEAHRRERGPGPGAGGVRGGRPLPAELRVPDALRLGRHREHGDPSPGPDPAHDALAIPAPATSRRPALVPPAQPAPDPAARAPPPALRPLAAARGALPGRLPPLPLTPPAGIILLEAQGQYF